MTSCSTQAQTSAGWMKELRQPHHTPETEEFGISSLIFRAKRPFHPVRLDEALYGFGQLDLSKSGEATVLSNEDTTVRNKPFFGVIRSKGEVWMATTHSFRLDWQSAGRRFALNPVGPFYAALPPAAWDNEQVPPKTRAKLRELMKTKHGDRSTELVCIGVDLDKQLITSALNGALLTDAEMESFPEGWMAMPDPFFGEQGKRSFFQVDNTLAKRMMLEPEEAGE